MKSGLRGFGPFLRLGAWSSGSWGFRGRADMGVRTKHKYSSESDSVIVRVVARAARVAAEQIGRICATYLFRASCRGDVLPRALLHASETTVSWGLRV